MMLVLAAALGVAGGLLAIPVAVLFFECALAVLPRRVLHADEARTPRTVVLIPAHDEELVIADTLASLTRDLPNWVRVVVVADNCTDRTAAVARDAGVDVLERSDPDHRGKAYALQHGVAHLKSDPPDVVIVVDADCRVSQNGIAQLARLADTCKRPIQADYLLEIGPQAGVRSRISAFAFAVRNRVRPRGLARLAMPCQLTGTGMAFPFTQFTQVSVAGSHLVEDLALGLELAKHGWAPWYTDQARVLSQLPEEGKTALGQRRRWEQGQLQTAFREGPKLLVRGLVRGSAALMAMALDLLVPPLALLVVLVVVYAGGAGLVWALGGPAWPAYEAIGHWALLSVGVGLAWIQVGRSILKPHQLLAVPFYVAWKLPLYLALLIRRGEKAWHRTSRRQAGSV